MRIMVGTLYCGENEFSACRESIARQTYSNFEHVIIKNLPNKEAHDKLYQTFIQRRDEFDLLVKVDADMILRSNTFFGDLVKRFSEDPELELLTVAVHDWFSDRLIVGINTYRNTITWSESSEGIFVDASPLSIGNRATDWHDLAPAADHSSNPSPIFSFHFGIHKALKIMQPVGHVIKREHYRMTEHGSNYAQTANHFKRIRDRRLGLAVFGAELTFSGRFNPDDVSWSSATLKGEFNRCAHFESQEIQSKIRRLKVRNGGWLPLRIRLPWLWYRYGRI